MTKEIFVVKQTKPNGNLLGVLKDKRTGKEDPKQFEVTPQQFETLKQMGMATK